VLADPAPLIEGETSATICREDEDFFSFPVTAGDGFVVQLRYDVTKLVLEAELYDGNDVLLDFVGDLDFTGFIQLAQEEVAEDGIYKVRVQFIDGQSESYSIIYAPVPDGLCLNDGAEPSDTPEQSSPLAVVNILSPFAKLCEGDEDWYRVDLEEGGAYRVVTSGFLSPVSVEVYLPDASTRILRDTSPLNIKTIPFQASTTGTHFVRIFSTDGQTKTDYEVNVNAQ
jgi:hypothetical protein